VLPLILAAMALYYLLPKPRNRYIVAGSAAGILALILAAMWLFRTGGAPVPERILFYAFAGLAVAGGGLMVVQSNPARAAICFALVVLNVCGLFLLQGAPFLMAATIVIYAGAIIVTFLFVLMLAQQTGFSDADDRTREPFLASFAGFALLGGTLLVIDRSFPDPASFNELLTKVELASRQSTIEQTLATTGDRAAFMAALQREDDRRKGSAASAKMSDAITDLEAVLSSPRPLLADVKPALSKVLDAGRELQNESPAAALPAANVAGIGKLLFTDHLLAVELGGTLLLVATIGAIAITGRRRMGSHA
jgi:NADH:ubiquinone oxidoreductase subunit 6 (subunit J)